MKTLLLFVKSIVMLLGLVTAIVIVISLLLFVCGDARLEWVDADGQGNGFVHAICDDDGWPIAYLRLSDYSSDNNVYLLQIRYTGIYDVKEIVKATRCNVDGVAVSNGKFTVRTINGIKTVNVELPKGFTPDSAGETLVLELSVVMEGGEVKESRIKFKSKKVYHQLSI